MMYLYVLSTLVVSTYAFLTKSDAHTPQKPAFCHDLDCPHYAVMQTFKDYELRKYETTKWIATNLTTMSYTDDDSREMFFRLFHYISGNNTSHMKIPMTAPVVTTIIHGAGPTCEATFIRHFMIPHDMQTNTPEPTDTKAYLVTMPPMNIYVKSFPGRPTDADKISKIEELAQEIGNQNLYENAFYYFAGYDGPYAIQRHNEVWLQAKH